VSEAWREGLRVLAVAKAMRTPHLVVTIDDPIAEDMAVRIVLDEYLARRDFQSIDTVANTLFPSALYHGKGHAHELFELYKQGVPVIRRFEGNAHGTYFQRMVAWPRQGEDVNQLERALERVSSALEKGIGSRCAHGQEIAISDPSDFDIPDIRIVSPELDGKQLIGFPCLSHISLTLEGRVLHMCAVYRSHFYIKRAYGNYLGLGRLLDFLSTESGAVRGELTCVSTLAQVSPKEATVAEVSVLINKAGGGI
jgi:hypothetical protein